MNFLNFFLFLWVTFALLEPDPDSESPDPLTQLNPIRIEFKYFRQSLDFKSSDFSHCSPWRLDEVRPRLWSRGREGGRRTSRRRCSPRPTCRWGSSTPSIPTARLQQSKIVLGRGVALCVRHSSRQARVRSSARRHRGVLPWWADQRWGA